MLLFYSLVDRRYNQRLNVSGNYKRKNFRVIPPPSFFNFAQTIVKGVGGGVGRLWWPMCAIGKSCRARVNQYFFCKNFYFID